MDCKQARELLQGYVDGELDLVTSLQIEDHLQTCADCRRIYEQQQALRTAFQDSGLYHKAPAHLHRRVETLIRRQHQDSARSPLTLPWRYAGMVAAAACLILFGWFLGRILPDATSGDQGLAQELVANHIRSLMPGHLADVISTNQHTVKPWFDGKVDFAPPVQDLAAQGFPLYGGRLDYLNGRTVAVLVYRRRKHFINLYVWPESTQSVSSESSLQSEARQGYQMLHWSHAGMTYWAVSDISPSELHTFMQHLLQPASTSSENSSNPAAH